MELSNRKQTFKTKTLGLALAAFLIPAGIASAYDGGHSASGQKNLSGHVEVVKQVPGGTVTVGVQIGKQPRQPQVVVVRDEPKVIVVDKQRGHGWRDREERREYRDHHDRRDGRYEDRGYGDRRVTVIHEEPRRRVTVIRTVPAHREVVVVKNDRDYDRDGHQRIEYRK